MNVLTINCGSSSIKCSLVDTKQDVTEVFAITIDRIGMEGTTMHIKIASEQQETTEAFGHQTFEEALVALVNQIRVQADLYQFDAIAHRVVYGALFDTHVIITDEVITTLLSMSAYDTEHMSVQVASIKKLRDEFPDLPHVACFDTIFHKTMPEVATRIPIPYRYREQGVRKHGFHGLSYESLLGSLRQLYGDEVANGKVIMAHLGGGASITALIGGRSVDTSMGFSPSGGIPMGTRSGDVDPGIVRYLLETESLSPAELDNLFTKESGLLGMSGSSAHMRDLLDVEVTDVKAHEAIETFCYVVVKQIGAYVAVLGGLDSLVFSGGIGEKAASVRERIISQLSYLGIEIDANRNEKSETCIATDGSLIGVYVLPANEAVVMAQITNNIVAP